MDQGLYHTIVSHRNFHHDEAWAIFLLKKYGAEKYPGIETAQVEFIDDPQGVNGLELVSKGKICIGCGGALYDEHGRERETCAAELVARHLELINGQDPILARALGNIIDYVRHCDRTTDVRPQELPSLIKQWHKLHRDNPGLVLDRTMGILEDWLNANLNFQKTYQATNPSKSFFKLIGTERTISYSVFETDNPDVPVVARIKKVDIVITKNSRGNVQVFTRSEKTANGPVPVVDLSDVIRIIRQGEIVGRGGDITGLDTNYLRGPEKLEQCPYWYYLESGQMLLNGSDQAAAAVEPTKLSLDDIVQAIKAGARQFRIASGGGLATIAEISAKK